MAGAESTVRPGDVKRITDTLRPLVVALEGSVAVLQAVDEFKTSVAAREDQLRSLDDQIAGRRTEAATLEASLAKSRAEFDELDAKLAAEKTQLAQAVQIERGLANEKVVAAKRTASDAEDEAAAAKERIERLTAEAQEAAKKRLKDLGAEIAARQEKADALVVDAEKRLAAVNKALAELKKKF